jgi:hypothetical protein
METEKPKPKWAGLGYEQVPGLANRIISRYLRGQRKNMERFFTERGLHDSAERMRQIRLSRQGMLAKNRMFQEVLGEYAQSFNQPETSEAQPAAEAGNLEGARSTDMVLQDTPEATVEPVRSGPDPGGGLPVVAGEDGVGIVIEE